MFKVISALEAKENDSYTIQNFVPSIELMERAGKSCYEIIKGNIQKEDAILVVCGGGGNGGDGLVIARYLLQDNYQVFVYLTSNHLKEETEINLKRYKGSIIKDLDEFIKTHQVKVIIDAIFGVGLNTKIKENYVTLINKLNLIDAYKVSIDINSGLDSTSGQALGALFKSDLTITIQDYKSGLFLNDGKGSYCDLKVIDIGIKPAKPQYFLNILEKEDIKVLFKKRDQNTNKGSYGRVALIGGSKLTPGALLLSYNALASLRCGVGYANIVIPKSLYNIYALKNEENIYTLFNDNDGNILFDEENLKKLLHYSSILVGPGIGTSEEVYKIIKYLLLNFKGNLVLDADALNSLSKYGVDVLKEKVCNATILTPHIKEFSRLSGLEIDEILSNSVKICRDFAKKYGVLVNLKNNGSVISDGEMAYLNINGNAGLAKGGSGDVLSGITLGLVNKNDNILLRVASAAYILGLSADLATQKINEYSLLARDVVAEIPNAINSIINIDK